MSNQVITIDGCQLEIAATGVVLKEQTGDSIKDGDIEVCVRWFATATRSDSPQVSSFWLRHFVSHQSQCEVSHGALIVAAVRSGFDIAYDPETAAGHVRINVDPQCISEYDCGCGS